MTIKIDSLDVMKAKEQLDLQEATRRDDVFKDLNEIVDKITVLPVFPSLVWVWSFDVLRSIYENNRFEDLWMRDNDFLVALDNDGWLDDEEAEDE